MPQTCNYILSKGFSCGIYISNQDAMSNVEPQSINLALLFKPSLALGKKYK